jgi:hypothetical protein
MQDERRPVSETAAQSRWRRRSTVRSESYSLRVGLLEFFRSRQWWALPREFMSCYVSSRRASLTICLYRRVSSWIQAASRRLIASW